MYIKRNCKIVLEEYSCIFHSFRVLESDEIHPRVLSSKNSAFIM